MEQVVENTSTYQGFSIKVAGKTGTAQESKKRPSHSLFIGYAPSDNPEMAFAIRIPHGHGSANAVAVSKDIVGCFFGDQASIDKANTLQAHESSTAVGD
jgi:penicillin-binding protein 2